MKLAIIGLEQSGKTTVFKALTGSDKEVGTYGKIDAAIAMVKVPDERIEWLAALYEPKKTVYADIEFVDIPGNINDSADPKIIAATRSADALVYVIRTFENKNVLHPLDDIDPARDFEQINLGLLVADMAIAEKRIKRLKVSVLKPTDKQEEEKTELAALEKVMEKLEAERPVSEAELTDMEEKSIRSFQFLTLKPHFTLLNVSEDRIASEKTGTKIPNSMSMRASIEMEIRGLAENDRGDFLKDLGMQELSINPFIRKAYETLGLLSFFTVGKDEVRAWTIDKGINALHAAGKIHSDLERGFIRAEVFTYDDLKRFGSEREIKNAGKLRLEGKNYIVQDGDILNIKF
ncbi:MAG: redox-regulated ATPase YchF, partial [Candidatus Omnitrophica bacterium]|nr:redox-regulated ATPase YchF [Candidatus Omnitrophota bacterium]